MKLTLVHPCIGKRPGQKYIRTWQMEPLPPAVLAGLTPQGVDISFFDDRMEDIDYDRPTDLAAISVETYTAKRSYQIASEFRRRNVPVVMGGFHAGLQPEEVSRYAESVVLGEAEGLWPKLLADAESGSLQPFYHQSERPLLKNIRPDRSIFSGKKYLPLGLVEAGRGCHFRCEFCAVQTYFQGTQTRRPIEDILEEIKAMKKPLYFFVDDNITSNMDEAKEFFRRLIPLKIRWVSQASINAAHDEEFLRLIKESGCKGLLIGFESLNEKNLRTMGKGFNTMGGGFRVALNNLRRYGLPLYATFIVGYDHDDAAALEKTLEFALQEKFYIVAFNHLTPFPGTPLYSRLQEENRLLFERWWMDPEYRYGMVPYAPAGLTPEQVRLGCIDLRHRFYKISSILRRSLDRKVNGSSPFMWLRFFMINWLIRREVSERRLYPLGDQRDTSALVPCRSQGLALPDLAYVG